jgi:hypothetical protein
VKVAQVIVAGSIASLKEAERVPLTATPVEASAGRVEVTVGGLVTHNADSVIPPLASPLGKAGGGIQKMKRTQANKGILMNLKSRFSNLLLLVPGRVNKQVSGQEEAPGVESKRSLLS